MTSRAQVEPAAPVEEILRRLDEAPPPPRDLYYRWETEQWEAGALSFARDRATWRALDRDQRTSIAALLGCFLVPDGRVGDLLVPFVDAVATEEQQVFLTSQLVDEARAVVFCDRLRSEVFDTDENASTRLRANDGVARLLDLVQPRAEAVRAERRPGAALHEGLLLLSVILEGVVAPTIQRRLGSWVEDHDGLPDLATGLRSLARDTLRHVHFAVGLIQEALGDDARDEDAIAPAVEALIEEAVPLVRAVVDDAARASNDFSGLPLAEQQLTADAMDCLALRMQDIGLDLPT